MGIIKGHQIIFCEVCKKDIEVEETEDGTLIVHCPSCTGECMVCDCHLVKTCFTDAEKIMVRHPSGGKEVST